MTIAYRDALRGEAQALAAFAVEKFVEAYSDQCPVATLESYADHKFTEANLGDEIAAEDARFFIAADGARIAGYALVRYDSFPECEIDATRPAQVERIYVDPAWQGRGVGRELLGRCAADARAAGCDVVWLAVWDANARAIRFYLQSGFEIVGEQPFVIGDEIQRDFVMAWPASSSA
jgi:ribosomal protein S18 acetylase RimI-like enzyme